MRYAPQLPDQPVHARFVAACHKLDQTEYYLDILCAGGSLERAEVVQQQIDVYKRQPKGLDIPQALGYCVDAMR